MGKVKVSLVMNCVVEVACFLVPESTNSDPEFFKTEAIGSLNSSFQNKNDNNIRATDFGQDFGMVNLEGKTVADLFGEHKQITVIPSQN